MSGLAHLIFTVHNEPAQIHFHSLKQHTITKMNDNVDNVIIVYLSQC